MSGFALQVRLVQRHTEVLVLDNGLGLVGQDPTQVGLAEIYKPEPLEKDLCPTVIVHLKSYRTNCFGPGIQSLDMSPFSNSFLLVPSQCDSPLMRHKSVTGI